MRYSPIALSVPENSATKRSGSGWPLREITARRRPAAQPSVRRCNATAPASDKLMPDAASSSRVSRSVNRRSSARISETSSASLSRCSLIGGSRRDDNTRRAELGRLASRCSSCVTASADLSSWRSSTISTTGSTCPAISDTRLSTSWSPSSAAVAAGWGLRLDRVRRASDRVQDGAPEPLRMLFVAVDGDERNTTRVGRAVSPCTQQRGLATSRRRRDDRDALAHSALQQLEEISPIKHASGD